MGETTITKAQFAKRTISGVSSIITTAIVLIVDALLGYFTYRLIALGYIPLAIIFVLIIAIISFSFLVPKAKMFRWMLYQLRRWTPDHAVASNRADRVSAIPAGDRQSL